MAIQQNYREKIIEEIQTLPREIIPSLYRMIRLLEVQWQRVTKKKGNGRGSLKGIWKGSQIDEHLFREARRSLFHYEDH
ncbi:MAG: hypothetical protein H8D67_28570 [Deltaproteobacteria bacterium]|nr:hypothetical protein [Deltaproteobacteria bacterium]MBL7075788.1 hypothetical protein [candidate division KSB1 bacterium]